MKIALKRFCHVASVGSSNEIDLDNGNTIDKFVPKFMFIYANLNQSISDKLSDLGNASTNKKVIATLDPRFENIANSDDYNLIQIGKSTFKIDEITKDDSEITQPFYELTIELNDSNSDD